MDEQQLIAALVTQAVEDTRAFRRKHPDDVPNEMWIENSYTAALPLAKEDAGYDPGPGPHPRLFAAYRRAIDRMLGERPQSHRDRERNINVA